MADNKVQAFVKECFKEAKAIPVTILEGEVILRRKYGNEIPEKDKVEAKRFLMEHAIRVTKPETHRPCPRCGNGMIDVILSKGRKAIFCTVDKVALPTV